MLDSVTKRRIDTARDILVGKVPDPKSQVEQITIALIYKFMDDMDAEAEELGGERKFFNAEFAKYGWAKLMSPAMGGHEVLNLYAEAIAKMTENEGIPTLFRDIFKNAYLPYRDPETLKSFLKIIDDFEYDHSERLGDAFEYLLSVLGAQGDAGQFRTPRHIIDFMVEVIDPKKDESILDPACGTAGFLISAYKHILQVNSKDGRKGAGLTPDERKRLTKNIKGYDISPDMVRLSLVNLYLHGFTDPHISEYDTLTSEDNWNEHSDIILANPPFMSPKGGIKPHKRFSIQAKRSEVLFVDYIAEHLSPGGRAAVIVPEGIIFQSQNAYKQLRKMLVENYLYAVISLPAGVFQPYSGVKTSILLMDKQLAKKCDSILFVKIKNDGFELGAQRRKSQKNDLPEVVKAIREYREKLLSRHSALDAESIKEELDSRLRGNDILKNVLVVGKGKIGENGEWNLSGERYRENTHHESKYLAVELSEVCTINPNKSELKHIDDNTAVSFVPMKDLSENNIKFKPIENRKIGDVIKGAYTYFRDGDVLLAKVTPCFENGKAGIASGLNSSIGFGSSEYYVLRANDNILPELIYYFTISKRFKDHAVPKMTGTGGLQRVPKNVISEFKIPLPPLKIQQEIVAEIEDYQKIIDGARAVTDNYKPQIQINPDWEMVKLGDAAEVKSGGTPSRQNEEFWNGDIPWLGSTVCKDKKVYEAKEFITSIGLEKSAAKIFAHKTTLIALVGATIGKTAFLEFKATTNQNVAGLYPKNTDVLSPEYLFYSSQNLYTEFMKIGEGKFRMANLSFIRELLIPLPNIETQTQIVAQIEKEQSLVNANKELITLFEQKIKDKIASVWGKDTSAREEVPA